jgi:hypothetical protein
MCRVMVPASAGEALGMLESALKVQRVALEFLADLGAANLPTSLVAECLQGLEQADAVGAAARGQLLAAFDAQDGSVADGQRTARTWLVHCTRVTRGQAAEHKAVQALAEGHRPLLAGLRGRAVTKSVALQLAKWTAAIPGDFRDKAEEILITAARAGRTCGRWRRSARRSAPAPPPRIPTMRTTGTWTAGCRSTPPSTGPG